MSKKSRRRNKKILGALALLGTGLALANRGKANQMSGKQTVSDAQKSTQLGSSPMDQNEFKVQDVVVSNVNNPNLSRMTGSGPQGGLEGQKIRRNYIQRAQDSKRLNDLRKFRSDRAYRGDMMTAPSGSIFLDSGVDNIYQSARKGGRIVKGKKKAVRTGAAKRGFGRAFKGGKK